MKEAKSPKITALKETERRLISRSSVANCSIDAAFV